MGTIRHGLGSLVYGHVPLRGLPVMRLLPSRWRPALAMRVRKRLDDARLSARIDRLGAVRVRTVHGTTLDLDLRVDGDYGAVYVIGSYETGTTELALRFLRPGDVVFDVGANLGWYTTVFARAVGKSGSVHAFEPSPTMFDRMERNCRLSGVADRVVPNRRGVGRSSGCGTLYSFADLPHGHAATIPREDAVIERSVDIRIVSLDEYASERGLRPTLIKVDVEGAELDVLEGSQRIRSSAEPPMWIFEVNMDAAARGRWRIEDLAGQLAADGYHFLRIEGAWGRWMWIPSFDALRHGDNVFCFQPAVHGWRLRS